MSKAVDSWLSPPLNLKLSSQEVHIWRVYIDTDDFIVKKLQPLLSTSPTSPNVVITSSCSRRQHRGFL